MLKLQTQQYGLKIILTWYTNVGKYFNVSLVMLVMFVVFSKPMLGYVGRQ